MSIEPSGNFHPIGRISRGVSEPYLRSTSPEVDNEIARQIASPSPPLLSEITAEPLTGIVKLTARFVPKTKKYLQKILATHFKNDPKVDLSQLSMEQLALIERMINRGGKQHLLHLPNIEEGLKTFERVEIQAQEFCIQTQNLSYIKMKEEEAEEFINEIFDIFFESPNEFSNFTDEYQRFLDKVEDLQKKRPQIFSSEETGLEVDAAGLPMTMGSDPRHAINQMINNLVDTTSAANTQIIQENWAACFLELGARTTEDLYPRRNNTHLCLYREQHPAIQLQELDKEFVIDTSKLKTEIYITHPETMETRAIRVPFPIQGSMTVEEAIELMQNLYDFCHGRESFHDQHPDFPHTGAFAEHERAVTEELSRALADFNSIGNWKAGTFARMKERTAQCLKEPSEQKAILATFDRTLYPLAFGRLSLLPPEIHESFPTIATFNDIEIANLMHAFLVGTFDVKIELPSGEGEVKIETQSRKDFLEMAVTIAQGEITRTRKTYYRLIDNDPEKTKQDVVDRNLLERDLALAKAAFMEESYEF